LEWQLGKTASNNYDRRSNVLSCDRCGVSAAMLLNGFLKEHREVQEQKATISRLSATVARQEATDAEQQKGN
jgi:hypothetical protein